MTTRFGLLCLSGWLLGPAVLAQPANSVERAIWFRQRALDDSAAGCWHRAAQRTDRQQQPAIYWKYRSQQALSLAEAGQYAAAQLLADSVQRAGVALLGSDNLLEAEAEVVRGLISRGASENRAALAHQQRALTIRRQRAGQDSMLLTDSYLHLGTVHFFLDEDSLALACYQRALAIRRLALGESHYDVAEVEQYLMHSYFFLGNYDSAIAYGEKARATFAQTIGPDNPRYAGVIAMLGTVYGSKGQNDVAIQLHRRAVALYENAYGTAHAKTARAYQDLGWAYDNNNEYDQALTYELQALRSLQRLYGDEHPRLKNIQHILGATYMKVGNYDQALLHFRQNQKLVERFESENRAALTLPLQNLGRVSYEQKRYAEADAYYQQALALHLKYRGEKQLYTVSLYTDMATNAAQSGDLTKALHCHQQALRVARLLHGERHADVARSYHELALTAHRQRKPTEALRYVQQTLEANLPAYRSESIGQNPRPLTDGRQSFSRSQTWNALKLKAEIEYAQFRTSRAPAHLRASWTTYQVLDTLMTANWQSVSETERPALAKIAAEIYQQAIPVCLARQANAHEAFTLAQKSKAMLLTAALADVNAKRFANIPDSLLGREKALRAAIRQYEQRTAQSADTDAQNALFTAQRQFATLTERLEHDYPRYHQLKYQSRPARVGQLQQRLDPQTALLEYALTDSSILVFTLTRTSYAVRQIPRGSHFTDKLAAFRTSIVERDQLTYNAAAHALYRQLFPTALPASVRNLIVVPAGELAAIPFEALLTQATPTTDEQAKPYLLRRYSVRYAYSSTLWYLNGHPTRSGQTGAPVPLPDSPPNLLAMAPVFADARQPTLALNQTRHWLTNRTADTTTAVRGLLRTGGYVKPLPATEAEIRTISQLIRQHGGTATVLLHELASEDALKQLPLGDYRYVHIATHGLLHAKPELSGLLLAQTPSATEDGILYSGELYNVSLNADLVVLSACETGLGAVTPGEGIMGLSRALLYAGARNVSVSLWQVSDQSSSVLMTEFYKHLLESGNQSGALRLAKLAMLRDARFAAPYFWSAFILINGGAD